MLTMIQLTCTHCGNQFELEKQEGAVCPSCGWASSVVPSSEVQAAQKKTSKPKKAGADFSWVSGFLFFVLKTLMVVGLIALVIWGSVHFIKSRRAGSSPAQPQRNETHIKLTSETGKKTSAVVLTPDELALLNSKLEVTPEVQLMDDEQKLLQRAIDLTAGNVEKLPSTSWTLAEFKEFIGKQEKVFHMPLPRSYKKSLEDLFQKTYATAYDLFLAGKIQAARDAYVASLGFPVYNNDVRRHRAVVLTMLRGFLNDTIAKIGAMNFTLARQHSSGMAEQIGVAYAGLQQQLRANAWSEALSSVEKIQALLPDSSALLPVVQAPPYVAGFEKIDGDIQPVLLKLLQVPAWAFDINDFKGDLEIKKTLLLKLTDPNRKTSIDNYNRAIEKVQAKAWTEAQAFLAEVKSPDELKRDAEQKINIIQKLADSASASVK